MVHTYTGTPGSGKSLHCAEKIIMLLNHHKNVICNFPINLECIKKKYRKNFYYLPDSELTPHYLFEFARAFHKEMKEDQTFLIIDEAQRLFPIDRVYTMRKEWEQFFQLHRHYGFSIILVTQNMSYINKGVRIQTEYEMKHRKVNNYGVFGLLLTLLHIPLFICNTYWNGTREKIYTDFFLFRKKYGKLYNTFSNFETGYSGITENGNASTSEVQSVSNQLDDRLTEENRQKILNLLFGEPEDEDPEQKEEIDADSVDFDEENVESWDSDLYISEEELQKWKSA